MVNISHIQLINYNKSQLKSGHVTTHPLQKRKQEFYQNITLISGHNLFHDSFTAFTDNNYYVEPGTQMR